MAKAAHSTALWHQEVADHGIVEAIKDRCIFHGGCTLNWLVENTGYGRSTLRKHLDRLVEEGFLLKPEFWVGITDDRSDDFHYKCNPIHLQNRN